MAEKTYKYNSICERDKPIHTNNKRLFTVHVASCPICKMALSSEMLKQLDPQLSEIIAQRTQAKKGPSEPKKEEPSEPKKEGITTIRFKATTNKQLHGSRGINLKDGQTAEVPYDDAKHCLKHWPKNFEIIGGYWPSQADKK